MLTAPFTSKMLTAPVMANRPSKQKGGDEVFSSGNVSEANLGEHYYTAVNDLHAPANPSAAVLEG